MTVLCGLLRTFQVLAMTVLCRLLRLATCPQKRTRNDCLKKIDLTFEKKLLYYKCKAERTL